MNKLFYLINFLYEFTTDSFVHLKKRNLHPGNLLDDNGTYQIDGLGLSIFESETDDIKDIKGVMPFMAPELLSGGSYSQATDVYAFGMIMWEISSNEKPFHEFNHDEQLALRICKGLRPEVTNDTPPFYRELMQKCWHSDPTKRPTAKEIYELSTNLYLKETAEIQDQIEKAEKVRQENMEIKKEPKPSHPGAIYTSRFMPNVSKMLSEGKF